MKVDMGDILIIIAYGRFLGRYRLLVDSHGVRKRARKEIIETPRNFGDYVCKCGLFSNIKITKARNVSPIW